MIKFGSKLKPVSDGVHIGRGATYGILGDICSCGCGFFHVSWFDRNGDKVGWDSYDPEYLILLDDDKPKHPLTKIFK